MAGRNLTDVYAAIAGYAGAVTGITSASYPAPPDLPDPPALFVLSGSNTIVHGSQQMHQLRVRTHLMVMLGMTEDAITTIDALLFPLVDAFAADIDDTDGFTLGGLVDRCVVSDWGELSLLAHGSGHTYFGYPVYFDVKMNRHAGVI